MILYINEEKVTEGSVAAVRECLPDNASLRKWYNSSVKLWNTFYKRVELRDQNGNLWGLELSE